MIRLTRTSCVAVLRAVQRLGAEQHSLHALHLDMDAIHCSLSLARTDEIPSLRPQICHCSRRVHHNAFLVRGVRGCGDALGPNGVVGVVPASHQVL